MPDTNIESRINNPRIRKILLIFSSPKTPKQAARDLNTTRIKLRNFLDKHLIECLNPNARKGKFYIASEEVRKCLNLFSPEIENCKDWQVIGWIISSPRQRLVIMRCVDERKLASEEIRMRATQFNSNLTRPATKKTLKHLVQRHLLDSEIMERIRFYWITEYGKRIKDELAVLSPLTSTIF